jgi:hypothetical protein
MSSPRRSWALRGKTDPMNATDIDGLIAAQGSLIAALDVGDVGAIEAATAAMSRVLAVMRADGAVNCVARDRVDHALKQSDAARTRVNYLADSTRQKLDRLGERRGVPRPPTYNATGRLAILSR